MHQQIQGKATKKFVWTLENTWTVVVCAVTAAILSVVAVFVIKMRKKIGTMSGS